MALWIKNTSGQPSASFTMMIAGFVVITLWLIVSIVAKIGKIEIRPFDAGTAMAYFVPLASLYFGRRYQNDKMTLDTVPDQGKVVGTSGSATRSTATPVPPPPPSASDDAALEAQKDS